MKFTDCNKTILIEIMWNKIRHKYSSSDDEVILTNWSQLIAYFMRFLELFYSLNAGLNRNLGALDAVFDCVFVSIQH